MSRKLIRLLPVLILLSGPGATSAAPADHLATALTYKTISHQDRSKIDYDEFEKLHHFLRSTYPRVFSQLEVEVINEYSLLIFWRGRDASVAPVFYTAHTDVVPVEMGTEGDWTHPPYDGVVENGIIYGRGTLDDKQGVIGLLEAVESLLVEGFTPERTIVFGFGHDEEISGREGAAAIAVRLQELGMHFAWMVDEGGMIISDNPVLPGIATVLINVQEKSYLTLTLIAKGEGGHSSMPPLTSTIGRLSAALAKIEQNPLPPRLVSPVKSMLEVVGAHSGQPERFIMENLWLTESLVANQMAAERTTNSFVRTTTALTMFNAGVKENVVPQRAEAKVNFRLLPGDTPEMVMEHVKGLVEGLDIEISYDSWKSAPPLADVHGPGFAIIGEATLAVYPEAVVMPSLLSGASDTRHYVDLADDHYRYHGVIMMTKQSSGVHGTDEYISVDSFEKSIEIARQMILLSSEPHPASEK